MVYSYNHKPMCARGCFIYKLMLITMETKTDKRRGIRRMDKIYMVIGLVICICAVAEFIIWIVDASKLHLENQILMGAGFLTISVGVLLYLLTRTWSYTVSNWLLWICIIGCIVLFFVGIAKTPDVSEAAGLLGAYPVNP